MKEKTMREEEILTKLRVELRKLRYGRIEIVRAENSGFTDINAMHKFRFYDEEPTDDR